jgi:hypothetical protein
MESYLFKENWDSVSTYTVPLFPISTVKWQLSVTLGVNKQIQRHTHCGSDHQLCVLLTAYALPQKTGTREAVTLSVKSWTDKQGDRQKQRDRQTDRQAGSEE